MFRSLLALLLCLMLTPAAAAGVGVYVGPDGVAVDVGPPGSPPPILIPPSPWWYSWNPWYIPPRPVPLYPNWRFDYRGPPPHRQGAPHHGPHR